MLWFILGVIVLALVAGVFLGDQQIKRESEMKELISAEGDDGFSPKRVFIGAGAKTGIAIDDTQGKIRVITNTFGSEGEERYIDFDDIVEVAVDEDGETITSTSRGSQVAGAVVGGLLLGGVGAILGGLSGKKKSSEKTSSYAVKIVVNDIDNPLVVIDFLSQKPGNAGELKFKKDSATYKNAKKQVEECHAVFTAIIKKPGRKIEAPPPIATTSGSSKPVKRLKNLYAILGISPAASQPAIKAAIGRAEVEKTVSEADIGACKKVLLNEEMRKKYDAKLRESN